MSDTELADTYPSPRKAILGNGHVANLRCAVKYLFWQAGHALLALAMGAIALIVFAAEVVYQVASFFGVGAAFERIGKSVARRAEDSGITMSHLETAFVLLFAACVGIVFLALYGYIVYLAFTYPLLFLATVGGLVLVGIWLTGAYMVWTFAKEEGYVEKAQETRGVRRIYNKCPVSWDIEPKWFESFLNRIGLGFMSK